MTYDLICEGRCNPGLARLDEEVAVARRLMSRRLGVEQVAGALDAVAVVSRLRALSHQPHALTRLDHARCVVCGTERRYGYTVI